MLVSKNVLTYWKGVVKLNYKAAGGFVCGWSEMINIDAATGADAVTILQKYMNHRAWTLPTSVTMVYASVIKVPLVRYSTPVDNLPIVGKAPSLTAPNVNDMDEPKRTFCLHMIVDEGKKSLRHIHGIPDDLITATALVPAAPGGSWIDLVTPSTDGTATPATYAAALKALLSFIGMNSYVPSQPGTFDIATVATPNSYRLRAITGILSREVRSRPVGRPFGLPRGRQPIH